MEVYESNHTRKPQPFPGKANGRIQQLSHEVSSRYKSPTQPRRFPSPNTKTTVTPGSNRAVSTGRRSSSPTTPVHDTSLYTELAVRKMTTGSNKLQESLWPSRMRSLNVAFQSNTYSMPVSKKEKPPTQAVYDRTLKPSSNVAHKQTLTSSSSSPTYRKTTTPERKRSPHKGKNTTDHHHNHLENSKPVVDQYRWPSRIGSNVLNKSIDLSDESKTTFTTPNLRRMSLPNDTTNKHQRINNLVSSNSLEKNIGSLPSSPIKSSGGSRGVNPSRTQAMVSASSRGISPSRIRSSSPSRQLCNSNTVSVLTFISDMKKGKNVASRIEDAHHLRLLYNREVQWRFVNASSEAVLSSQKLTAEKSLVNAQRTTSQLQDSVATKRNNICQLKLQLKLYLALNQQIYYLNQWSSIEREHSFAVKGAIGDLQASTLRLPVIGCATANIENVKSAIYSAIQVMQTMGSSMQSTLSRLEEANWLVSELATVAAQERALLDQYESLMTSTSSLQIKEYSLRTHLVQLKSV